MRLNVSVVFLLSCQVSTVIRHHEGRRSPTPGWRFARPRAHAWRDLDPGAGAARGTRQTGTEWRDGAGAMAGTVGTPPMWDANTEMEVGCASGPWGLGRVI